MFICEYKFERLNPLQYSPDPSEYFLFRNLMTHLYGTGFRDTDELNAATDAWSGDQTEEYISTA